MSRRLDIDALRALQAIAVCGGVTRAADFLSLSQSAVSHKIKRLEESIGCGLLNRRAGAPLLTESGNRLLGYADRILSLHDEALQSLSARALSGKIRLGMTEDTTSSGLARILGRFTRLFPEVVVRTHVAQSLTLQDELKDGTIDIAVMQIFARDIRARDIVLYEDSLVWAKAIDLELDWDRPVPFLAYDDNCFYKTWMLEQEALTGRKFETVLKCSSNAGIITGVESGLGVSILNRRHVSTSMDVLTDGFTQPPHIAYIVRTSSKTRTRAVAALAEEIQRETSDFAALEAA
ncbi:MAG: LysR family transcriptional regulator [Hyphomicrobiaceae bacterium]